MASSAHIGIIGSGLIGKSWAMIFASVGYKVEFLHFLWYYQFNIRFRLSSMMWMLDR